MLGRLMIGQANVTAADGSVWPTMRRVDTETTVGGKGSVPTEVDVDVMEYVNEQPDNQAADNSVEHGSQWCAGCRPPTTGVSRLIRRLQSP